MPKKTRPPEEIQEVKQNILNMALELISEDGYDDFSMRKLAARLHISATSIYQYYANKDELYLAVLTRGFEELYARMLRAYEASHTPMDRLRNVSRAYIHFGINEGNFYNIMMVWSVPKFYDYVGTAVEPIALTELNTALQVWEMTKLVFAESGIINEDFMHMKEIAIFQFACTIHGFVSYSNSKLVEYLLKPRMTEINDEFTDQFIDMAICSLEKLFEK